MRKARTMENNGNRRRRIALGIAAIVVLAFACIALANCSAEPEFPDDRARASKNAAETQPSRPTEAPSDASESENAAESDPVVDFGPQSGQTGTPSGKTTSQDAVSGVSGGSSQTYPPAGETPPTQAPEASGGETQKQPVWVVDHEDVWVEDSPAWDESVPIYGYTEVSVCNVCGADITGNAAAHGKQHMLAGEGSGHHSEVRETVIGYETVYHDAAGHWERVESGGHWE